MDSFQGLFKTNFVFKAALHFQVLFKPVRTLTDHNKQVGVWGIWWGGGGEGAQIAGKISGFYFNPFVPSVP